MRKVFFILTAFIFATTVIAQNKKQETIEGNGKSVTRDISVSSFDVLKASGVYELRLTQGDKESVKIEADENMQEYFNVRNEGSKLIIEMDKLKDRNLKTKTHMKVYVTFKKLKEMDLSTVGNVVSENKLSFENLDFKNKSVGNVDLNMSVNKLELNNKSVGNVKLSGKAQDVVVKNNGVGNLRAGSFVVQTMYIDNTSVGNAEVNAEKNLKVKDSFLGKVSNKGTAQMRRMNKVRV